MFAMHISIFFCVSSASLQFIGWRLILVADDPHIVYEFTDLHCFGLYEKIFSFARATCFSFSMNVWNIFACFMFIGMPCISKISNFW